jgi:hypothetical protein
VTSANHSAVLVELHVKGDVGFVFSPLHPVGCDADLDGLVVFTGCLFVQVFLAGDQDDELDRCTG